MSNTPPDYSDSDMPDDPEYFVDDDDPDETWEQEWIRDHPERTIQSATVLSQALDANTEAINTITSRYRFVWVAIVINLMLILFVFQSRFDSRKNFCVQDNQVRSGLLHIADTIEQAAKNNPAGQSQASKDFIVELRTDFAVRDCSDIGWLR